MIDIFEKNLPCGVYDVLKIPATSGVYAIYARINAEPADWNSKYTDGNENGRQRLIRLIANHSRSCDRYNAFNLGAKEVDNTAEPDFLFDTEHFEINALATDIEREQLLAFIDRLSPIFSAPLVVGAAIDTDLRSKLELLVEQLFFAWHRKIDRHSRSDLNEIEIDDQIQSIIDCGFCPEDLVFYSISIKDSKVPLKNSSILPKLLNALINRLTVMN